MNIGITVCLVITLIYTGSITAGPLYEVGTVELYEVGIMTKIDEYEFTDSDMKVRITIKELCSCCFTLSLPFLHFKILIVNTQYELSIQYKCDERLDNTAQSTQILFQ